MSKYLKVAEVLIRLKELISEELIAPEDEMHKLRLMGVLQREADFIKLITQSGDIDTGTTANLGPATSIGGVPISKVKKFTEEDLIPSDDKVHQLKKKVEKAWNDIPGMDPASVLAAYEDIVIRGVAKKAGMFVNKDQLPVISVQDIEGLQDRIAFLENQNKQPGSITSEPEPVIPIPTQEKATTENTATVLDETGAVINSKASLISDLNRELEVKEQALALAKTNHDKAVAEKKPKAEITKLKADVTAAETAVSDTNKKLTDLENANND